MTRFASISSAAILSLGLAACGDDGGDGNDVPDTAVPPGPDACVGGHGGGCNGVADLPEGGILRVEYLHNGNDANGRLHAPLRAYLLAFENQANYANPADTGDNTPRPWLGPLAHESANMQCFDQSAGNLYFTAWGSEQQAIADTRTYYADMPASVDITARNNGAVLALNSVADRYDPAQGVNHPQMFLGEGSSGDLIRGDSYDMAPMAPTTDFPGIDLVAGYDIPAGAAAYDGTPGSYLAPDFVLDSPTEDAFYAATGFYVDPSQDLTINYTYLDNATIPAGSPTPVWFVGFAERVDTGNADLGVKPTIRFLCLGPAATEGSGTATVPQSLFADAGFPASGVAITGVITHTAWAMNDTHRFDIVGMNCDINMAGYVTTVN